MENSKGVNSPTIKYGSKGWEYKYPQHCVSSSEKDEGEIELHTFNDWQSIKADPSIDIYAFIDKDLQEDRESKKR